MSIDWSALTRLVPEIAIAVIFVLFILEWNKRLQAADEAKAKIQAARDELNAKLQDERETKRDALWREFLKEQREQTNAAIGRLAEEIKSNTLANSSINALLVAHDTMARQFMADVMPAVRRIETATVEQ